MAFALLNELYIRRGIYITTLFVGNRLRHPRCRLKKHYNDSRRSHHR